MKNTGPRAELEVRLIKLRKIWKVDIVVLNKQLGEELSLILKG